MMPEGVPRQTPIGRGDAAETTKTDENRPPRGARRHARDRPADRALPFRAGPADAAHGAALDRGRGAGEAMGGLRPAVAQPAARGDRRRGCAVLPALRLRFRRDWRRMGWL